MRGMPPTRPGVSNTRAKRVREAMRGGGGAYAGTRAADGALGNAIARGHQEKVYGDPASRHRVVGYGAQAPRHRRKRFSWATLLLVLLVFAFLVSEFAPWW